MESIEFIEMIRRLSVKVGDLVRDKDERLTTNRLGIVAEIDEPEGMFKVIWTDQGKEWLTQMYLEVLGESR